MNLREMYETGMSISQIAKYLGVNSTTIRHRMKKEQITPRPKGGTCTFDIQEAVNIYTTENVTLLDVAKRMGVHRSAIHEQFKKLGMDTSFEQYDRQLIHLLRQQNKTTQQISDEIGISKSHLRKILRQDQQ